MYSRSDDFTESRKCPTPRLSITDQGIFKTPQISSGQLTNGVSLSQLKTQTRCWGMISRLYRQSLIHLSSQSVFYSLSYSHFWCCFSFCASKWWI